MFKTKLAVVIPALNEPYLHILLKQLQAYTVTVRGDQGLSYAVWKGIEANHTNIVAVMDADGSHSPNVIPQMVDLLDKNVHLVVGSRYCRGGYSLDSFTRKIISRVYCLLAQIVLRTNIKDCMSGFWVGYRFAFKFNPSRGYKFGLQLIRNNKDRIAEFPIIFEKRKSGKTHVKPVQALKDLFAIFRR